MEPNSPPVAPVPELRVANPANRGIDWRPQASRSSKFSGLRMNESRGVGRWVGGWGGLGGVGLVGGPFGPCFEGKPKEKPPFCQKAWCKLAGVDKLELSGRKLTTPPDNNRIKVFEPKRQVTCMS